MKQTEKLMLQSDREVQLVNLLAHELRSPLNLISFSASMLESYIHYWSQEKILNSLQRIQAGVEILDRLIDEVLIIGKAEAGKLNFEPKPLNVLEFCHKLVAELEWRKGSEQMINFISQGDCSSVCADEKILKTILTNLLDNAIKYSPTNGTINFVLSRQREKVIFRIKDRGIGIPAEDLQKLFEPFHRGTNVDDLPGSGLGLAIVRKLVEIHGGEIALSSEVGLGTTVRIALPLSNEKNFNHRR
jgi:signal transduction histidine kinase